MQRVIVSTVAAIVGVSIGFLLVALDPATIKLQNEAEAQRLQTVQRRQPQTPPPDASPLPRVQVLLVREGPDVATGQGPEDWIQVQLVAMGVTKARAIGSWQDLGGNTTRLAQARDLPPVAGRLCEGPDARTVRAMVAGGDWQGERAIILDRTAGYRHLLRLTYDTKAGSLFLALRVDSPRPRTGNGARHEDRPRALELPVASPR